MVFQAPEASERKAELGGQRHCTDLAQLLLWFKHQQASMFLFPASRDPKPMPNPPPPCRLRRPNKEGGTEGKAFMRWKGRESLFELGAPRAQPARLPHCANGTKLPSALSTPRRGAVIKQRQGESAPAPPGESTGAKPGNLMLLLCMSRGKREPVHMGQDTGDFWRGHEACKFPSCHQPSGSNSPSTVHASDTGRESEE